MTRRELLQALAAGGTMIGGIAWRPALAVLDESAAQPAVLRLTGLGSGYADLAELYRETEYVKARVAAAFNGFVNASGEAPQNEVE